MMRPDPWYRRFLDHPPPMPDHVWAYWLMGALILFGLLLGIAFCLVWQEPASSLTPHVFQQQLSNFEHRLRALERR
jgi:hypothetical protein